MWRRAGENMHKSIDVIEANVIYIAKTMIECLAQSHGSYLFCAMHAWALIMNGQIWPFYSNGWRSEMPSVGRESEPSINFPGNTNEIYIRTHCQWMCFECRYTDLRSYLPHNLPHGQELEYITRKSPWHPTIFPKSNCQLNAADPRPRWKWIVRCLMNIQEIKKLKVVGESNLLWVFIAKDYTTTMIHFSSRCIQFAGLLFRYSLPINSPINTFHTRPATCKMGNFIMVGQTT